MFVEAAPEAASDTLGPHLEILPLCLLSKGSLVGTSPCRFELGLTGCFHLIWAQGTLFCGCCPALQVYLVWLIFWSFNLFQWRELGMS